MNKHIYFTDKHGYIRKYPMTRENNSSLWFNMGCEFRISKKKMTYISGYDSYIVSVDDPNLEKAYQKQVKRYKFESKINKILQVKDFESIYDQVMNINTINNEKVDVLL